jgi:alpha-galactosidase
VARYLANFIGVPVEECRFVAVGMNHLTWFLKFEVDGEDAWPRVRDRYAALEQEGKPYGDSPNDPLSWELFQVFGAFPAVMDRHVSEFFPQFHRTGEHYGQTLGVHRFSFEGTIERGDRAFASMADQAFGRAPMPDNIAQRKLGEHEQLVEILNSLQSDSGKEYSVIIPNEGQVTNIAQGFAIECPAAISRKGIEPIHIGKIPTGIRATVEKALLTVELAVEAAIERDRHKLLQALITDGSVKSVSEAGRLADEMLEAHKDYLPGW